MKTMFSSIGIMGATLAGVASIVAGIIVWQTNSTNQNLGTNIANSESLSIQQVDISQFTEKEAEVVVKEDTPEEVKTSAPATTVEEPTKVVTPAKPVITNCLPENPSVYQETYTNITNGTFLKNGSYAATSDFYDALEFSGLLSTVNANKATVFAVSDYVFQNNLTPTETTYVNSSAAKMKELLGWHVITSCKTWQDDLNGKTVTLSTMNGNVTYNGAGMGTIGDATGAIYDWFTKNGVVHFLSDFIDVPTP